MISSSNASIVPIKYEQKKKIHSFKIHYDIIIP